MPKQKIQQQQPQQNMNKMNKFIKIRKEKNVKHNVLVTTVHDDYAQLYLERTTKQN